MLSVLQLGKSLLFIHIDKKYIGNIEFHGNQFGNPSFNFYEMRPIDLFKLIWTGNITQTFVEQTNLCSVQEQGNNISTCAKEIEQFLGMHILMGMMKLPDYNL